MHYKYHKLETFRVYSKNPPSLSFSATVILEEISVNILSCSLWDLFLRTHKYIHTSVTLYFLLHINDLHNMVYECRTSKANIIAVTILVYVYADF